MPRYARSCSRACRSDGARSRSPVRSDSPIRGIRPRGWRRRRSIKRSTGRTRASSADLSRHRCALGAIIDAVRAGRFALDDDSRSRCSLFTTATSNRTDRSVAGHWEGDLIVGPHSRSAIGTLVERQTRFVKLLHLPAHNSTELLRALVGTLEELPPPLRRTVAWDQGTEMARHLEITQATGARIYFCDSASPWQRGSNENTNGLLRQYFPKSTDLSIHTARDLARVENELNRRPRITLGDRAPADLFEALLPSENPLSLR